MTEETRARRRKLRSARRLAIALTVLLALVGIGYYFYQRAPVDKSLLTDYPCRAPCWAGLIPGQSSETDVYLALLSSPWVKSGSLKPSWTSIAWYPKAKKRQFPNLAAIRDGKLLVLTINIDYRLTLGEVVEKYGPPEAVHAYLGSWHHVFGESYTIYLDYPAWGLIMVSHPYSQTHEVLVREGVGVLSPEFLVEKVTYFAPTGLEAALRDLSTVPSTVVRHELEGTQPWQGFGEVKLAD